MVAFDCRVERRRRRLTRAKCCKWRAEIGGGQAGRRRGRGKLHERVQAADAPAHPVHAVPRTCHSRPRPRPSVFMPSQRKGRWPSKGNPGPTIPYLEVKLNAGAPCTAPAAAAAVGRRPQWAAGQSPPVRRCACPPEFCPYPEPALPPRHRTGARGKPLKTVPSGKYIMTAGGGWVGEWDGWVWGGGKAETLSGHAPPRPLSPPSPPGASSVPLGPMMSPLKSVRACVCVGGWVRGGGWGAGRRSRGRRH